MKLINKILEYMLLIIVVLLVISIVIILFVGQYLIKVGVETAATKALNVGVDINDLDLSIFNGTLGIDGLVIKNPPGYNYKNLLEMGNCHLKIDIKSLLSETVKSTRLDLMV